MKPYYEDGSVTIYHGDCREILPSVAADAAFADPPYNVGINYGDTTNDKMSDEDYLSWTLAWFAPLRAAVDGAIAITPGMVSVPMWIADVERTHFLIAWTKANNNSRNYIGATSGYFGGAA